MNRNITFIYTVYELCDNAFKKFARQKMCTAVQAPSCDVVKNI